MGLWPRVLAYFNEACMLASAAFVILGWRQIRRRRIAQHRRLMLSAASLGAAFFISYAVKTLLFGDNTFGGPAALAGAYLTFLQIHVTLATVAGILGVVTIRYALRGRFRPHRRVAPWTATMWLVAAASGLAVFLLLYVIYPTGPATNVGRTLVGGGRPAVPSVVAKEGGPRR